MKGNIMNKESEALEAMRADVIDFRDIIENSSYSTDEDYKIVKQALKRNEPIKPKVAWKNEEDKNIVAYRCLNCNGSLGAKLDNKPMFPNFCRHCGQRLDWSDEQ